jgi:hypothetical protein
VKFLGEDGVDAGGVKREFFSLIIRDLFNPQYGISLSRFSLSLGFSFALWYFDFDSINFFLS